MGGKSSQLTVELDCSRLLWSVSKSAFSDGIGTRLKTHRIRLLILFIFEEGDGDAGCEEAEVEEMNYLECLFQPGAIKRRKMEDTICMLL